MNKTILKSYKKGLLSNDYFKCKAILENLDNHELEDQQLQLLLNLNDLSEVDELTKIYSEYDLVDKERLRDYEKLKTDDDLISFIAYSLENINFSIFSKFYDHVLVELRYSSYSSTYYIINKKSLISFINKKKRLYNIVNVTELEREE